MSINGIGKNKADLTQIKAGLEFKTIKGVTKNESIFKEFFDNDVHIVDTEEPIIGSNIGEPDGFYSEPDDFYNNPDPFMDDGYVDDWGGF